MHTHPPMSGLDLSPLVVWVAGFLLINLLRNAAVGQANFNGWDIREELERLSAELSAQRLAPPPVPSPAGLGLHCAC